MAPAPLVMIDFASLPEKITVLFFAASSQVSRGRVRTWPRTHEKSAQVVQPMEAWSIFAWMTDQSRSERLSVAMTTSCDGTRLQLECFPQRWR